MPDRNSTHSDAGLGDDLVLRPAIACDSEALVELNTRIFDERITCWASDLTSGRHPTVEAADFTVVEDMRAKKIVSSTCLISQIWRYGGIPFQVGRAELVATDPDYRRRGLVRKQFDALHDRSASKGELMQVITGVDWFYRQFGYEMGVKLSASRCVDARHLAPLNGGEAERYRLRTATCGDHAFIRDVYDLRSRDLVFSASRSRGEWDYEFGGRSQESTRRREWLIIEDMAGQRLGYVQYLPCIPLPQSPMFRISQVELVSGAGYLNLMPDLLHGLWEKAQVMFDAGELQCNALMGLELALERDHPLYHAMPKSMVRETRASPWYIRIPDMAAFLRRIRPALEMNLASTIAEGYSGELKLNFFRSGIIIEFDRGSILSIKKWQPTEVWQGDARFPDSSFLQLVCGWHRFGELSEIFADCCGTHKAVVLLDHLFPSFHGKVWVLA